MRVLRAAGSLGFFFSASAFAADLKIRVVDPHSAAVAGAQVLVLPAERSTPTARLTILRGWQCAGRRPARRHYRIQVLAPGFAPYAANVSVPRHAMFHGDSLACERDGDGGGERDPDPVPVDETGASVSTLESGELTNHAAGSGWRCRALPAGRGSEHGRTARRPGVAVRARRGFDLQQSDQSTEFPSTNRGERSISDVVPLAGGDRLEFLRGAQSTLYGSDAMTSVLQLFSATGSSAHSGSALRGGWRQFFYCARLRVGTGRTRSVRLQRVRRPVQHAGPGTNNDYSNSLQGANAGSPAERSRHLCGSASAIPTAAPASQGNGISTGSASSARCGRARAAE